MKKEGKEKKVRTLHQSCSENQTKFHTCLSRKRNIEFVTLVLLPSELSYHNQAFKFQRW